MTYISVDIEADGPIPGDYSMIAIGACDVLTQSHRYVNYLGPISDKWVPEALAVSGFTRAQTLDFRAPGEVMVEFADWVKTMEPPYTFVADNNGFDWSFVNWYMHHFLGSNPFGFSSRNLNDVFHGIQKDMRASFKKLRKTKHDHNPLNDARGNAEAIMAMVERYGLKGIK